MNIQIGDKFQGQLEFYNGRIHTWTKTITDIRTVPVWTSNGIKEENRVYTTIHWDISPLGEVDCLIEDVYMLYDDFINSNTIKYKIS